MKRLLAFLAFAALICACSSRSRKAVVADSDPIYDFITTHGTIRVQLFRDTPLHLENFEKLVEEHYYDSTLFYRVVKGFVIQFGDITTRDSSKMSMWGDGGKEYTIPAEFRENHRHQNGALAAARMGDDVNPNRESAGSDFYFVHDSVRCARLNGAYTVFGQTIEGFEVIDAIASVPTVKVASGFDQPTEEVRILSIVKE